MNTPPDSAVIIHIGHVSKSNATNGRIVVHIESSRGTNFVGDFTTITTASGGAWVTRTLTGIINSTVQIVIENGATGSGIRTVGVREIGSVVNRFITLTKNSTLTMNVKTNASGEIEIYGSGSGITFRNVGKFL